MNIVLEGILAIHAYKAPQRSEISLRGTLYLLGAANRSYLDVLQSRTQLLSYEKAVQSRVVRGPMLFRSATGSVVALDL